MKKYILIFGLVILLTGSLTAQQHRHRWGMRHHDRIEELKKMKLIEVLDMEEETSVRFFERRKEHQKRMQKLMSKRDSLLEEIDSNLSKNAEPAAFDNLINELHRVETSISKERQTFFQSLSDILDKKQIATIIIFEHQFQQKLRDLMFKRGRGPKKMQRPDF